MDYALWLLLPLGRTKEAVEVLQQGEKVDPVSPAVQYSLGMTLIAAAKFDEAAAHCSEDADCLGRARLGQGRIDDAIRLLASNKSSYYLGYLGYAYGRAGRSEEARKLVAYAAPNAFAQALIYAGLGDKDRTLEAFERVAGLGAVRIGRALNSPEFTLLHDDLRARDLRKRVGLPD